MMATNDDQMRLSVLAARRLCTGRRSLSCSDLFILEDCLAEELTCAICMDIIDSPMLTACGHVFCVTCINLSLRELCHCPMCKALLTFDMIYPCYPLKSIADQIRKVRISRQAMLESSNNDNDNLILLKKLMSKSDSSDNSKNNRIVEALDINDGNKYCGRRRSSIGQDIILAMTFMTVISNPDSDGFNAIQQIDGERSEMDSWSRCLQMMYKLKNALIDTYIVDKTKQTGSNPTPLKNLALALQKVVKYDHLRELYCWKQNNCLDCGTAQIVTSLSCSKLNGCCAMSIVTRKINVFQTTQLDDESYELTIKREFITGFKPSCVQWHTDDSNKLIFSDYGGCVHLVDISRNDDDAILSKIQAHRDKCWSIDVHPYFPKLIATASQDRTVKILDTDYCRAAMKIALPCASSSCGFSPSSSRKMIVVGLADHVALIFDLRNTRKPYSKPIIHNGPLAYSMFLDENDILTSAAACEIKISSVFDGSCKMRMGNHENRRYFVGLHHNNGDYILSGSENGFVHLYVPELPVPVISNELTSCSTSALSFRPNSDEFFCGDRQGNIRLMQLQAIPKDKSIIDAFKSNLYQRNKGLFR